MHSGASSHLRTAPQMAPHSRGGQHPASRRRRKGSVRRASCCEAFSNSLVVLPRQAQLGLLAFRERDDLGLVDGAVAFVDPVCTAGSAQSGAVGSAHRRPVRTRRQAGLAALGPAPLRALTVVRVLVAAERQLGGAALEQDGQRRQRGDCTRGWVGWAGDRGGGAAQGEGLPQDGAGCRDSAERLERKQGGRWLLTGGCPQPTRQQTHRERRAGGRRGPRRRGAASPQGGCRWLAAAPWDAIRPLAGTEFARLGQAADRHWLEALLALAHSLPQRASPQPR